MELIEIAAAFRYAARELYNRGEYGTAVQFYERALIITSVTLGDEHSFTATIHFDTSHALRRQRKWAEARAHLTRSLEILEKTEGANNPHTATVVATIAQLAASINDLDDALVMFDRAIPVMEATFGTDHQTTREVASQRNLVRRWLLDRDRGDDG